MVQSFDERAVVLDKLDEHLKTILRFKLREFVHLSPCFEAVPSIDMRRYPIDVRNYRRLLSLESGAVKGKKPAGCPNKQRVRVMRRPALRVVRRT